MRARGILSVAAFMACASAALAAAQPAYPLKASANRRYLVDQNDVPVLLNGDTPWSLVAEVSREDAELYLLDRAARGVNSIIVNNPEPYYCTGCFNDSLNPKNYYGDAPFTEPGRLSSPNEAYFESSDWVIQRAGDLGIQVVLDPAYIGSSVDGFWNQIRDDNTVEDCRAYGEWYGTRYRGFPNVIYLLGGDRDPNDEVRDKLDAMAQGLRAADPSHLITFHAASESSSTDAWDPVPQWLELNATYVYSYVAFHPYSYFVWEKSYDDYNHEPTMPIFLVETVYENMHLDWGVAGGTPLAVRRQAYNSVLSGSAGHFYGNAPIWSFGCYDDDPDWVSHLGDPGAATLFPNLLRLFESREWYKLVPDQGHEVLTAGYGDEYDYAPTARTSDGGTILAYVPTPRTVTIDMSMVAGGAGAHAWWYNPRDGSAIELGSLANDGSQQFTPPDAEDWVLVVDDASRGFPEPGTMAATIRFESSRYEATEGGAAALVRVRREGDTSGPASVRYATSAATATEGQDFEPAAGVLEWAAGDSEDKQVSVAMVDDACVEGAERLGLSLQIDSGATLGFPANAELVIADDEAVVTNITAASGAAYVAASIDVGDEYYLDRSFTVASIPASYVDLTWIMTANDDKGLEAQPLLTFDLATDSQIYLGHDERISPKPDWLAGWTDTGDLVVDDQGTQLRLFERAYEGGGVELGENAGATANMYVVLIRPQPQAGCGQPDGGLPDAGLPSGGEPADTGSCSCRLGPARAPAGLVSLVPLLVLARRIRRARW